MREYWREVTENGFAVLPSVVSANDVDDLIRSVSAADGEDAVRKRNGVYAIRNLLHVVPAVAELALRPDVRGIARKILGNDAVPVKGILFDKTPDANWLVPWHQDLTISVSERIDVEGYGPWTVKAGVVSVQPPIAVLESMVAMRVHLDDCDEGNGALRVLPGTHRGGRLTAAEIAAQQAAVEPVMCTVPRGGVVLMKPLLLHASSAATQPNHRRVIHIDFANVALPGGLSWFSRLRNPSAEHRASGVS